MNKFWIVLWHTYITKLKAKSFIVITLIVSLLTFAVTNLNHIINFFNKDEKKIIGVIDQTEMFYEPLKTQLAKNRDRNLELKLFHGTEKEAKQKVKSEKWDAFLTLAYDDKQLPKATYYANTIADSDISGKLEQALQQLKTALATAKIGLKPEQVTQLYEPVPFQKIALEKNAKTEAELNQARGLVYALVFAMYMFVLMYGSMIASEVATEKSSRVMEILISSVSPVQQMFGKIIGVALLSLTQFSILFAVGFSSLKSNEYELFKLIGIAHIPASTLVYAVIFFLLGYLLYATLFATLGSMVSRLEDVQMVVTPVTLLVLASFFIAMFGLDSPESPFITVTSFIPFFAPLIMFLRIGMLDVAGWEIALSIALLIGTIVFFAYIGAKIYRGGVLMYGRSTSWKDMKKAIELTKK
ncbi:ABC-2 type transport system permease protein [Anoxybacillus tepidamans]|uniref:ABC-2 type transport system permease protein n=1 Tax=Anoxybacteroides tepidamans TaxID=265948 RepID=A0A7W8IRD3_9BACL|nr:ABC transporter permease [Anoxybacillus tepidamans]MBB5325358.1 ABC-2 type transport system permease protein [Anoxybacillus tepidamans]